MIKVKYSSVDSRNGKWRSFKTLKRARLYAQYWIGENPEIGSTYAVSGDGVGKIEVRGIALAELFGKVVSDIPKDQFAVPPNTLS